MSCYSDRDGAAVLPRCCSFKLFCSHAHENQNRCIIATANQNISPSENLTHLAYPAGAQAAFLRPKTSLALILAAKMHKIDVVLLMASPLTQELEHIYLYASSVRLESLVEVNSVEETKVGL